jgi:PilZ domain
MRSTLHQKPAAGSERCGQDLPVEVTNRRATPRYRLQFRTVVSSIGTVREGTGTVLDLSLRGCRVEASFAVQRSLLVELRIYVPDLEWPLMVDGRWCNGFRATHSASAFCDCGKTKSIAWHRCSPESR